MSVVYSLVFVCLSVVYFCKPCVELCYFVDQVHKNKIKTCGEVYADSAYTNKKNDEKLGQQNNKVLHRA
jgi:hypothetical protein